MSLEELGKLSTKQLLARLRQLHQCEESALLSDRDDAGNASGTILFKDTPEWKAAYEQVKGALSLREHIPNGAELAGKRHERALLSQTIEKRAGRRKPHRNAVIPYCLILLFGARQSFAQDEFLLAKHQAGAVVIGMTIDDLHAMHKPSSTRLVAHYPEGMFTPLLEVYLEGDTNKSIPSLLIEIDKNRDWIVGNIKVNDARFRTDKGIGVGSTLGAIRKAYAVKWIGFGEGTLNTVSTYYFIAGLALALAGVPLLRGWIPRNRWAGFRVPKTLSNDRIWYEANRVAGRDLMIAGAVAMATAGLSALIYKEVPGPPLEKINKAVFYGALFVAALHSFIALRRI